MIEFVYTRFLRQLSGVFFGVMFFGVRVKTECRWDLYRLLSGVNQCKKLNFIKKLWPKSLLSKKQAVRETVISKKPPSVAAQDKALSPTFSKKEGYVEEMGGWVSWLAWYQLVLMFRPFVWRFRPRTVSTCGDPL